MSSVNIDVVEGRQTSDGPTVNTNENTTDEDAERLVRQQKPLTSGNLFIFKQMS
jgi:hypothetical protein